MALLYYNQKGGGIVPVLIFLFTFCQTVKCQCMRSLRFYTATPDYQEFSSPGYPVYYSTSRTCTWRLYAQNASHAVRIEFVDSSIEYDYICSFDYCQVFDGETSLYSASLGKFCGTQKPAYVSTNDSMTIVFVSDASVTSYGFKARYKSGPRSSLLTEETVGSIDLSVILGSTLGCLAFLVLLSIIFVLAYKYKQAQKSAVGRQRPRTTRPTTSIRVRPCGSSEEHQLPPAYEEIQGTRMSPPPGYSADNQYPYPASTIFAHHMDSNTNYWSSENEKVPWKKEPLDDKTDMVTNTRFVTSRRGTVTNISNNVDDGTSAGTSGVHIIHALDGAALLTATTGEPRTKTVTSPVQVRTSKSNRNRISATSQSTSGRQPNTGEKFSKSSEPEQFFRRNQAGSPREKTLGKNVKVSRQSQPAGTVASAQQMSFVNDQATRKPTSSEATADNCTTSYPETSADSLSISSDFSYETLT